MYPVVFRGYSASEGIRPKASFLLENAVLKARVYGALVIFLNGLVGAAALYKHFCMFLSAFTDAFPGVAKAFPWFK